MADKRPSRGATLNRESQRFNLPAREADGDWLDDSFAIDGETPRLRTTVTVERARTIISRNSSPDIGFDRSINPYRGCEHGPDSIGDIWRREDCKSGIPVYVY